MSLHIVVDCRMIFMSGIGRYLREVMIRLVRSNDYNFTCLYNQSQLSDLRELEFYSQCKWLLLRSNIFSIAEQFELMYKIPRCDIFWSPQYNVPVFVISRIGCRIVVIHDVYQLYAFHELNIIKKIYVKLMINYAVLKSDAVITDSQFSCDEIQLRTLANQTKINVINCAVDENFAKGFGREIESKCKPYLLIVGNVKPHKNISCVIRAFNNISESIDYDLIVVGKNTGFMTGEENLVTSCSDNSRIQFTGYVSDEELKKIYANAALFIFPSKYEGFGLPVLEAMTFNIPVLCSNIPVLKELFGDSVKYFDPYDVDSLSSAIMNVINSDDGCCESDYSEIIKMYSWDKSAEHHKVLFDSISKHP